MIKFEEAKGVSLSYGETKISWDQAIEILKTKRKYSLKASTGLTKGYGFEFNLEPAKLKFHPMGIEIKTSSLNGAVWSRGIMSITGQLWSGDDSSVIIDILYSVNDSLVKVQIVGQ
jgi:hypothetical protein